jgi:pyrroline-5-carboxylate reductase
MRQLAILGGGFMGGALAEGLIDSGWSVDDLIVAEVREARREFLTGHLGLDTTSSIADAVLSARSLLFAVKPQDIAAALEKTVESYDPEQLVISICAGVKTETFENVLSNAPVIRSMPNTPASIGAGATAIAKGQHAGDSHLATAINILSTVGKVVVVEEDQMDAVTAVSGTGPAYVFLLAELLIEAAQQEGLTREQAHVLSYQTILGAARLLGHDAAGPKELRDRVTSPGGTTHAAITHLETHRWREIFVEAVGRARERSAELGA